MTVDQNTLEIINFGLGIGGILLAVLAIIWGIAVEWRSSKLNSDTRQAMTRIEEKAKNTQDHTVQLLRETQSVILRIVERGGLTQTQAQGLTNEFPDEILKKRSESVRELLTKVTSKAHGTITDDELIPLVQTNALTVQDYDYLLKVLLDQSSASSPQSESKS